MNTKNIAIGVLVLVLVVLGYSYANNQTGANSGTDHYNMEYFLSGLVIGGERTATSTTGTTVPLRNADIAKASLVDVTLNIQDATLSMPASSTITFLPRVGDTRTIFIRNATTTATMDLTISGGTGVLLKKATGTDVAIVQGDTDGANFARVEFIRKANSDIEALLTIFND